MDVKTDPEKKGLISKLLTVAGFSALSIFGLILGLILLFLGPILGAFLWPYTINSWLEYYGKEPAFAWWHGALFGFVPFLNLFMVFLAVATFVAKMFF